jgi:hypothetical protein
MEPDAAERACFEAGVKFGSLYHQFAGTPISPDSAGALAAAIEAAIGNQPGCESVTVDVRRDRLRDACDGTDHGYVEFTGRFYDAEVVVEHEGHRVVARMALENGYPRMRVVSVE